LLDRQEAIVELDVVGQIEIEGSLLEPGAVALAFSSRDTRMRAPGDHVQDLRMALDDRRERFDHRLESLPLGEEPEGRKLEALVRPGTARRVLTVVAGSCELSRAPREHCRRPV